MSTTRSNIVSGTPSGASAPDVIDNLFDDGVDPAWTGTRNGGSISLISDPTGYFGGRQVSKHAFAIADSSLHLDNDVYRYYEGYSGSDTVYVAYDVVFTNFVEEGAQRKLIYLKGGRGYGDDGSWASIVTLYGTRLYLAGDRGNYVNTYQVEPYDSSLATYPSRIGNNLEQDNPYRIEFRVTTNTTAGASDGIIQVWLTDILAGVGTRELVHDQQSFNVWNGTSGFPSADRIQMGDQLDNGNYENNGVGVADDRIFDRMMISSAEIGTYGL